MLRRPNAGCPNAGDDARSTDDTLAGLGADFPLRSENHIDTGAELDEANALARFHNVAGLFVDDDSSRDEPCDLFEGDLRLNAADFALHRENALLIGVAGFGFARDQELAFLVIDAGDFAGDRRAIHVDVEDVEEDADASRALGVWSDGDHFAVSGRDRERTHRGDTFGIAKEIQAENRQEIEG